MWPELDRLKMPTAGSDTNILALQWLFGAEILLPAEKRIQPTSAHISVLAPNCCWPNAGKDQVSGHMTRDVPM